MFNVNKNLVGLDIGSSAIKVIELSKENAGIKILSAGVTDNPVKDWKEKNIPEADDAIAESIKDTFKKFSIKDKTVAIALGTSDIIFDYLKFPVLEEKELANAVKLEAEQRISSDINEVSIDYKRLGIKDPGGQENILLVAVPKEIIRKKVSIVEKAGLEPLAMDVEPLALLNCLIILAADLRKEKESIGILNIGSSITNLGIISSDNFPTIRNINFGGDKFSNFIAKAAKVSFKEAEALEKEPDKLKLKGIDIFQMFEKESISLINEIISSIEYTHKRTGESAEDKNKIVSESRIKKMLLTGGGCLISGIDSFLSKSLGIEVLKWNPLEKVQLSNSIDGSLKDNGCLFPIAIGLGMRMI
ncbi:MAG: type IV pilus assembly protein PilM [Candidatus Ratteibacteria bacterium]|nr:type IV pilus assembly protein PilM [Candidatus Ratteibacteria bacterium]